MDAATVREIFGPGISEGNVQKLVGADERTAILSLEALKPPTLRDELSDLLRSCTPYEVTGTDSAKDIQSFLMDFSPLRGSVPSASVPSPVDEYYGFFKKVEQPSKFASLIGLLISDSADSINLHTIWALLEHANSGVLRLSSFGNSVSERGAQYFKVFKPTLSPDSQVVCSNSLLLYSEEKEDNEQFFSARRELLDKLSVELPAWLYGKLKFLVCYAATPGRIQFYMMEVSKSGPRLRKITPAFFKDDPVHRIMVVLVALKMYFLLMGMEQAVYTQPMYPLGHDSQHGNSLIKLTVMGARKIIPEWDAHCEANQVDFDTIVEAYIAARHAQGHLVYSVLLPRLIKASELPLTQESSASTDDSSSSVDSGSIASGKRKMSSSASSRKKQKGLSQLDANSEVYVVQTSPLCGTKVPRTESDLREMTIGVVRALRALHSKGLVHRDIREPNVMYDYEKNKYVLIDLEGVCKAGQVPCTEYKCWDGCTLDDGTFSKKSDYQFLGLLLSSYTEIPKSADCEKFIELLLNKQTDDANALLSEVWFTNHQDRPV